MSNKDDEISDTDIALQRESYLLVQFLDDMIKKDKCDFAWIWRKIKRTHKENPSCCGSCIETYYRVLKKLISKYPKLFYKLERTNLFDGFMKWLDNADTSTLFINNDYEEDLLDDKDIIDIFIHYVKMNLDTLEQVMKQP